MFADFISGEKTMSNDGISVEKILEIINEVGGERYKDLKQSGAAERMLAVEIFNLQKQIEKRENEKEESTITSFHVGNQILEVANNPSLKNYMMVCFWDSGGITSGWGGKEQLDYAQLSFGLNILENKCKKEMFSSDES